jgi:prefoldin subunit 5
LDEKVRPLTHAKQCLEKEKSELEKSRKDKSKQITQMERENTELRKDIEDIKNCLSMEGGEVESEEVWLIH